MVYDSKCLLCLEDLVLAEERTSKKDRQRIMEGLYLSVQGFPENMYLSVQGFPENMRHNKFFIS